MVDTRSEREGEVRLELPTSGQVLGALARNMGIDDHRLRSKSARRYYSGRLEERVKESSRQQVIEAIAEALTDLGLGASQPWGDDVIPQPPTLAEILDWHVVAEGLCPLKCEGKTSSRKFHATRLKCR